MKGTTYLLENSSASGISPEMSEQDQLLEEIVAMETEGEITNDANVDEKRKAQDMRKKAMEKLGDTIKRKENAESDRAPEQEEAIKW